MSDSIIQKDVAFFRQFRYSVRLMHMKYRFLQICYRRIKEEEIYYKSYTWVYRMLRIFKIFNKKKNLTINRQQVHSTNIWPVELSLLILINLK